VELSRTEARRVRLAAQGFDRRRPAKPGVAQVLAMARRVQAIDVDSINVLARSHQLVPFSRLGGAPRDALDRLTYERHELFEGAAGSTHLLPVERYPLLRYKMDVHDASGARTPNGEPIDPAFVDAVYDEVAARGPITVAELSDGGPPRGTWWGWSNGKAALEHLWRSGRLAIAGREDFVRLYDLTERVIPAEVLAAPYARGEEGQKDLLCLAAAMLGLAPARGLATAFGIHYDHYRALPAADGKRPRPTWSKLVPQLVEDGRLVRVAIEGRDDESFFAPAGVRVPRHHEARSQLPPFDEVLADADVLFGFEQRLGQQLYVPAARREYGYYVLPFLLGDELVARCDLKADRSGRQLLVLAAYAEPGHDRRRIAAELVDELRSLQRWLGLDGLLVGDRGDLVDALRAAVRHTGPRP
jgi:uncharacterized protein YcaQ